MTAPSFTGRWVWPVPMWDGRAPKVSDGFSSKRAGLPHHGGVDIMFGRQPRDLFRPGSPNASAGNGFVMPDFLVAVAAGDGVVWEADKAATGYQVVIDHSPVHAATFYAHLENLFVTPTERGKARQRVVAGQPLGFIGGNPLEGDHLKHLHFEIWAGGPADRIDPEPVLNSWNVIQAPPTTTVARNARRYL